MIWHCAIHLEPIQPSLQGLRRSELVHLPSDKSLGYYRMSLRDSNIWPHSQ